MPASIFPGPWRIPGAFSRVQPGGPQGVGERRVVEEVTDRRVLVPALRVLTGAEAVVRMLEAYKVTEFREQTQTGGGSGNPFCDIFGQAFNEILGSSGYDPTSGVFKKLKIDRWYVRGIGLVREEVVDADNANTVFSVKTLISCSGLPDCP